MTEIMQHEQAQFFNEPVDDDELPDYRLIVSQPIHFGLILNRLRRGNYTSVENFKADMDRVYQNAYLYNDGNDE